MTDVTRGGVMAATAAIQRTLAILALVAVAITVITVVAMMRRRVSDSFAHNLALPLATAVAVVATTGSLYLSEVAGYVPCLLCWYQRIAMYPLVIILGVAALRRDRSVWLTAVPIASIGTAVSGWHIMIEQRPALGGVCDPVAPCALKWVEEFGFLTLPTMALIGFGTIIVLTLAARAVKGEPHRESQAADPISPQDKRPFTNEEASQ
ncbi:MAG: disulfide bond formation protein B [Nitriliruptoraceae bacterium]